MIFFFNGEQYRIDQNEPKKEEKKVECEEIEIEKSFDKDGEEWFR